MIGAKIENKGKQPRPSSKVPKLTFSGNKVRFLKQLDVGLEAYIHLKR